MSQPGSVGRVSEPDRPDPTWSGSGPSAPAPSSPASFPAGWYPDPSARFEYRWFNGTAWTGDVAADGRRFVDGAPTGPAGGPPARRGNGLATAALTCGILAAVLGWIPVVFVLAAVLAVLAIVFGIIGLARSRERGSGRGFAITGIVTGSVGIIASIVGAVFTVITFREVDRYLEPEPSTVELTSCEVVDDRAVVAGTIRNDGDRRAGFTVEVAIERAGSGVVERTVLVPIEELDPGDRRTFETARAVRVDEIDCVVVEVTGPLPFGIDPG
jgi:hypothetical protein